MTLVVSNNGTTHWAEQRTHNQHKDKKGKLFWRLGKRYNGYLRKVCDGQWVPITRKVSGTQATCKACSKR